MMASWRDRGTVHEVHGDSLAELADELRYYDYAGPSIQVTDADGAVLGHVSAAGWTAAE